MLKCFIRNSIPFINLRTEKKVSIFLCSYFHPNPSLRSVPLCCTSDCPCLRFQRYKQLLHRGEKSTSLTLGRKSKRKEDKMWSQINLASHIHLPLREPWNRVDELFKVFTSKEKDNVAIQGQSSNRLRSISSFTHQWENPRHSSFNCHWLLSTAAESEPVGNPTPGRNSHSHSGLGLAQHNSLGSSTPLSICIFATYY